MNQSLKGSPLRVSFSQLPGASQRPALRKVGYLVLPWICFLAMLVPSWRIRDLSGALPSDPGRAFLTYGDDLEVTWGLNWYYEALIQHQHALGFNPRLFAPDGWQVSTFAHGPMSFIPWMPLVAIGGAGLAYNVGTLLTFWLVFTGMYKLSRHYVPNLWAILAALLVTFWGYRWLRISGQLNILLGAALLPWLAWGLEMSFRPSGRAWRWLAFVGVLWAIAITSSLYFLWLGGVVVASWVVGWLANGRLPRRQAVLSLALVAIVGLGLSAPYLVWFWRGTTAAHAPGFDLTQLNTWGASLNSLPLPFGRHPDARVRALTATLYHGPLNESGTVNFGLTASMTALVGLLLAVRDRRWWPVMVLAVGGVILALGPYLKWDGNMVSLEVPGIRLVNGLVWTTGHNLKPAIFPASSPPKPFDTAIPLPYLALEVLIPFWEDARVTARFALTGGIGLYLLAVLALVRLRPTWAKLCLVAFMLIELLPAPALGVPYPPRPHPVFDWLRANTKPEDVVIDLYSPAADILALSIRPSTLTATLYHQRATVAGTSSVLPGHTQSLNQWLVSHPRPFQEHDFAPLLRSYKVRLILLHVQNPSTQALLDALRADDHWWVEACFSPAPDFSPWPYPICVIPLDRADEIPPLDSGGRLWMVH